MARTYLEARRHARQMPRRSSAMRSSTWRIAELNGMREPEPLAPGQRLEMPLRRELTLPPPAALQPARAAAGEPAAPHGLNVVLAEFGDIYAYLRDDGSLDPRWETEQLARAPLPFPIALSWDPTKHVRSIYCHRRLTAKFQEVFAEIDRRGLSGKVRSFGGCFNFRAKRSGSKLRRMPGPSRGPQSETNVWAAKATAGGHRRGVQASGFVGAATGAARARNPMHSSTAPATETRSARLEVALAEADHERFPQARRVLAEHHRGIGIGHVPEARLDFLLQLARAPADEAGEVARVVRRLLDDAVHRLGVRGDEDMSNSASSCRRTRRTWKIEPTSRAAK